MVDTPQSTPHRYEGETRGVRWNALITQTSGGKFAIERVDVTNAAGEPLILWTRREHSHANLDDAKREVDGIIGKYVGEG